MIRAAQPDEAAVRDLEERTLPALRGELTRLVYLASTRDYNTGRYQHDGLAHRFTPDAAQTALRRCHEATFRTLVFSSLRDVVRELDVYAQAAPEGPDQVLDAWRRLEAYRVLIPAGCDSLAGQLFVSNVKIALEILRSGGPRDQGD